MTTGWLALDRLLQTDGRDSGCDGAREVLDVYAELLRSDPDAARESHPDVAAHLDSCGPCADDLVGLLAAIESAQP